MAGPWYWAGQNAAETQEGSLEEGPQSITGQQTVGGGTCCLLYPLRKPQAMCVSGHISSAIRELLGGSFDII